MRSDRGPWQDPDIMTVIFIFTVTFFLVLNPILICKHSESQIVWQMVRNGEHICSTHTIPEEKIISEDESANTVSPKKRQSENIKPTQLPPVHEEVSYLLHLYSLCVFFSFKKCAY